MLKYIQCHRHIVGPGFYLGHICAVQYNEPVVSLSLPGDLQAGILYPFLRQSLSQIALAVASDLQNRHLGESLPFL